MDGHLQRLETSRCSEDEVARFEEWMGAQAFDASDVEQLIGEVLEMFERLSGNEAAQAVLLSTLAVQFHKLSGAAQLGDLTMLAMFLSELATSESPLLLPSVIDLAVALYCGSIGAIARENDEDGMTSCLCEIESLRQMISGVAAQSGLSTLVRMHSVNAQRDIVLALCAPTEDVEIKDFGKEIGSPSGHRVNLMYNGHGCGFLVIPTDHSILTPMKVAHIVEETLGSLLAPAQSANAKPALTVCILEAAKMIFCNRKSTWDALLSRLCAIAANSGDSATTAASRMKASGGTMRTLSVELSLRQVFALILAVDDASLHHPAAKAALEACGGEKQSTLKQMFASTIPSEAQPPEQVPVDILIQRAAGQPFQDEEATELTYGSTEASNLIQTGAGPLSLKEMVEMIIFSMKTEIHADSDTIENLHFAGLAEMQRIAAREAQKAELLRMRKHETQGVAEVPPGQLVEYVKDGMTALNNARLRLESPTFRSMFSRVAFESVMTSYKKMGNDSEAKVRQCQALIARSLVQLPDSVSDIAFDVLCESVVNDVSGGVFNSNDIHNTFSLVMQVMFMLYAQLAPIHQSAQGFGMFGSNEQSLQSFSDEKANQVNAQNPIAWMEGNDKKRGRVEHEPNVDRSLSSWEFKKDTATHSTAYSSFATRIIAALRPSTHTSEQQQLNTKEALKAFLLEAPAITTPMWHFILKEFCLSDDKKLCQLGVHYLFTFLIKRPVYSYQVLTILLSLCVAPKVYPRMVGVSQMKSLLTKNLIAESEVSTVVQFASQQLEKIPSLSHPNKDFLQVAVERQLHLFTSICMINKFSPLLTEKLLRLFVQCGENEAVKDALVKSKCIETVLVSYVRGPNSVVAFQHIVPNLKNYPPKSERMVQRILQIVADECRHQRMDKETLENAQLKALWTQNVRNIFKVCAELFANSSLVDVAQSKDVRFMIPVLCYVGKRDLRKQFVPACLQLLGVNDTISLRAAFIEMLLLNPEAAGASTVLFPEEDKMDRKELLTLLHELHQSKPIESITNKMAVGAIDEALNLKLLNPVTKQEELVYDVPMISRAIHQLSSYKPIPTVTMRTAIQATRLMNRDQALIKNINNSIVRALIDRQVWTTDKGLWKGAEMFISEYWPYTAELLTTIPDKVLRGMLAGNPTLLEHFKTLPNVNRYSHILAGI